MIGWLRRVLKERFDRALWEPRRAHLRALSKAARLLPGDEALRRELDAAQRAYEERRGV